MSKCNKIVKLINAINSTTKTLILRLTVNCDVCMSALAATGNRALIFQDYYKHIYNTSGVFTGFRCLSGEAFMPWFCQTTHSITTHRIQWSKSDFLVEILILDRNWSCDVIKIYACAWALTRQIKNFNLSLRKQL